MADHGKGELEFSARTKPQDAQGNRIPAGGAKSVEIFLRDFDGRDVLLKENVIFSFWSVGKAGFTIEDRRTPCAEIWQLFLPPVAVTYCCRVCP